MVPADRDRPLRTAPDGGWARWRRSVDDAGGADPGGGVGAGRLHLAVDACNRGGRSRRRRRRCRPRATGRRRFASSSGRPSHPGRCRLRLREAGADLGGRCQFGVGPGRRLRRRRTVRWPSSGCRPAARPRPWRPQPIDGEVAAVSKVSPCPTRVSAGAEAEVAVRAAVRAPVRGGTR
jgi:hypothetical protein